MKRQLTLAALLAATAAIQVSAAHADEATDLAAIRKQLNGMQHEYEAKIKSLETRLARAERDAKTARTVAQAASAHPRVAAVANNATEQVAQAVPPSPLPPTDASAESAPIPEQSPAPSPAPPTSQNAFNPGIAAVLNGFLTASSHDTKNAFIPGFAIGDEAGLPPRGFSIGKSEMSFAANIDPHRRLSRYLVRRSKSARCRGSLLPHHGASRRPHGQGRALPLGHRLSQRTPRPRLEFLRRAAAVSRVPQHPVGDDGVQVRWLAPTDQFLEFGAEAFRGEAYPAPAPRTTASARTRRSFTTVATSTSPARGSPVRPTAQRATPRYG